MPYIDRVIEWFEEHTETGAQLNGRQCKEIARRLRSETPLADLDAVCAKPGQHAPGCGCYNLVQGG